jgi:hypothetical protein
MCLSEQDRICVKLLQLFAELLALPRNAIRKKCYEIDGLQCLVAIVLHEVRYNFLIATILSSDTAPL